MIDKDFEKFMDETEALLDQGTDEYSPGGYYFKDAVDTDSWINKARTAIPRLIAKVRELEATLENLENIILESQETN